MKKGMRLLILLLATISMSGIAMTPASAATWHKGTPKSIRGHWKQGYRDRGKKVFENFDVNAKTINSGRPGWPAIKWTHLKYKKVGATTYRLKGTYRNGGTLTEKNSHMQVHKKHGKITYKHSWSKKYSYLGWLHK